MKKLAFFALVAVCLTSCWTARICTVVPSTEIFVPEKTVYSTQVTTPSPKTTVVTTVTVTNYNTDMCFYLDLNAVAAAFAEANSIREFEQILNSSRYMINNLDLNRDGWVDYLRVIETYKGYYHALLIQSCLAPGVFQDVATLVAEWRADRLYVEVIGDAYLYGYNYIVRPVFIKRPPMWDVYGRSNYACWSSPYYYGAWPSYYTQPKPVYLNHYQAYVNTYMTNHHYCHHCDYPTTPYYSGYTSMTQSHHRNDYYNQHPDQGFEQRVTRTIGASNTNGVSVRNAGQLRNVVAKEVEKKEEKKEETKTTSTRTPSTTVDTRVKSSGATRTTIKTTDNIGRTTSVKRETSTRSSGTSTRSTQGSTRSESSSSRTSGSTRSSSSSSRGSNPRASQPSR